MANLKQTQNNPVFTGICCAVVLALFLLTFGKFNGVSGKSLTAYQKLNFFGTEVEKSPEQAQLQEDYAKHSGSEQLSQFAVPVLIFIGMFVTFELCVTFAPSPCARRWANGSKHKYYTIGCVMLLCIVSNIHTHGREWTWNIRSNEKGGYHSDVTANFKPTYTENSISMALCGMMCCVFLPALCCLHNNHLMLQQLNWTANVRLLPVSMPMLWHMLSFVLDCLALPMIARWRNVDLWGTAAHEFTWSTEHYVYCGCCVLMMVKSYWDCCQKLHDLQAGRGRNRLRLDPKWPLTGEDHVFDDGRTDLSADTYDDNEKYKVMTQCFDDLCERFGSGRWLMSAKILAFVLCTCLQSSGWSSKVAALGGPGMYIMYMLCILAVLEYQQYAMLRAAYYLPGVQPDPLNPGTRFIGDDMEQDVKQMSHSGAATLAAMQSMCQPSASFEQRYNMPIQPAQYFGSNEAGRFTSMVFDDPAQIKDFESTAMLEAHFRAQNWRLGSLVFENGSALYTNSSAFAHMCRSNDPYPAHIDKYDRELMQHVDPQKECFREIQMENGEIQMENAKYIWHSVGMSTYDDWIRMLSATGITLVLLSLVPNSFVHMCIWMSCCFFSARRCPNFWHGGLCIDPVDNMKKEFSPISTEGVAQLNNYFTWKQSVRNQERDTMWVLTARLPSITKMCCLLLFVVMMMFAWCQALYAPQNVLEGNAYYAREKPMRVFVETCLEMQHAVEATCDRKFHNACLQLPRSYSASDKNIAQYITNVHSTHDTEFANHFYELVQHMQYQTKHERTPQIKCVGDNLWEKLKPLLDIQLGSAGSSTDTDRKTVYHNENVDHRSLISNTTHFDSLCRCVAVMIVCCWLEYVRDKVNSTQNHLSTVFLCMIAAAHLNSNMIAYVTYELFVVCTGLMLCFAFMPYTCDAITQDFIGLVCGKFFLVFGLSITSYGRALLYHASAYAVKDENKGHILLAVAGLLQTMHDMGAKHALHIMLCQTRHSNSTHLSPLFMLLFFIVMSEFSMAVHNQHSINSNDFWLKVFVPSIAIMGCTFVLRWSMAVQEDLPRMLFVTGKDVLSNLSSAWGIVRKHEQMTCSKMRLVGKVTKNAFTLCFPNFFQNMPVLAARHPVSMFCNIFCPKKESANLIRCAANGLFIAGFIAWQDKGSYIFGTDCMTQINPWMKYLPNANNVEDVSLIYTEGNERFKKEVMPIVLHMMMTIGGYFLTYAPGRFYLFRNGQVVPDTRTEL